MANIRGSTGDDEFRSYMNDFETYLHNIGSDARTASPELMTSSVENGEQVNWNNDVRNMSEDYNPVTQQHTSDLKLDEECDSYTYNCQQMAALIISDIQTAAVNDYIYGIQQSDDSQQHDYSVYEPNSDVTADNINEPAYYDNVDAGPSDHVTETISTTEIVEMAAPQTQVGNDLAASNDDDDDDEDDETDDYIEHEYLIAERMSKQQGEKLDNDVTQVNDSDDRSTDDNGEGITDSLTEGEYYLSQQPSYEVQPTYHGTADHQHCVTGDVQQYYVEDTTVKVDDYLVKEEVATTCDTEACGGDTQHLQRQPEEDQFDKQTLAYYDTNLHSSYTTDQTSISVTDDCVDNELHQQQHKQVKFSVDKDLVQQLDFIHDDDNVKHDNFVDNVDDHFDNRHHHHKQLQDDDENEQRPSERGRIRDLLAHWRQFEQQISRTSGPSRSFVGSSGQHTRSRSCGPVTRRHPITTYDNSRSNDDSATPYNVNDNDDDVDNMNNLMNSSDLVYKRAAILAKFENLDAEAHKTSMVQKKREFKWAVKETTSLGRPVGLHCS